MEITVSSRHTEVSELLRESTVDKIGRLGRFLEGMDRAEVHFSEEHTRRSADKEVCEVTMAARVVREIGADRVSVVAAARTPLKRARARSDTEDNVAR